jgi:peptidoglycan/xylan/chitin deacetylase (PgdA/CDA1 family)
MARSRHSHPLGGAILLGLLAVPVFPGSAALEGLASAPEAPHGDSLRVPILVYHSVAPHDPGETETQRAYRVSPERFEAQMEILRDAGIAVVPLARLVAALLDGEPLPPRSVVLTFDDGWANQYRHAFPVLVRHGYPATFFVFTNPIGRDTRFMDWGQLRELTEAGMTVGSHSRTHPYLGRITDPAELRREVEGSRTLLEERLGVEVRFFAYPFGEWSPALEASVRDGGYLAARGFPGGVWNGPQHRWSLRAVAVTDDLSRFRALVGAGGAAPGPTHHPVSPPVDPMGHEGPFLGLEPSSLSPFPPIPGPTDLRP